MGGGLLLERLEVTGVFGEPRGVDDERLNIILEKRRRCLHRYDVLACRLPLYGVRSVSLRQRQKRKSDKDREKRGSISDCAAARNR